MNELELKLNLAKELPELVETIPCIEGTVLIGYFYKWLDTGKEVTEHEHRMMKFIYQGHGAEKLKTIL